MLNREQAIAFFKEVNTKCFHGFLVEPRIRVVKNTKYRMKGYFGFSSEIKSSLITLCPAYFKRTPWQKVLLHEMTHCFLYNKWILPTVKRGNSKINDVLKKADHTQEFWSVYEHLLRENGYA